MKKILKIQFWRAEHSLEMQILELEGLLYVEPNKKNAVGIDHIFGKSTLEFIDLNYHLGICTAPNLLEIAQARDNYLADFVKSITDTLFTGTEPKVEECGNVVTYTWEEE